MCWKFSIPSTMNHIIRNGPKLYFLGALQIPVIATLWEFNVAMQNGPFIVDLLNKHGDFPYLFWITRGHHWAPSYLLVLSFEATNSAHELTLHHLSLLKTCFFLVQCLSSNHLKSKIGGSSISSIQNWWIQIHNSKISRSPHLTYHPN